MKYKCQRENQELCIVTVDTVYAVGDTIKIRLDSEIIETVSILEIVE